MKRWIADPRRMLWTLAVLFTFTVTGLAIGARPEPGASRHPENQRVPQAPDLDVRGRRANALPASKAPRATPAQEQSLNELRGQARGLVVRWSALTSAPSRLHQPGGTLTAASRARPQDIAESFLQRHQGLFNLSARDLSEKRYARNATSAHNGVTHLEIQQRVNGIDVFGATLAINIDRDGRILNVGGELIPGAHAGANAARPTITEQAAIAAATAAAGLTRVRESRSEGLVYFPVGARNLRLAWKVVVADEATPNSYRTLVDAGDGTVLWRLNGTRYDHIATHGLVFDGDSPIPRNPIGSTDGSVVDRADRPFHGAGQPWPVQLGSPLFAHDDVHFDWWNGATRDLSTSNNVMAQEDRDGNNSGGTQATTGGDDFFNDGIDFTQEPDQYIGAAVTNLFYWVNRTHDIWYRYGFTEPFGNYQTDNFGLGGSGGDPVIADAQDNRDGGKLCNANFDTNATEGSPGRMQMFLCNSASPELDGDFSNPTIVHEYHHGMAERLRPTLHGSCDTSQGAAIGEGGGDFQGLLITAEPADDPNGSYAHSQYYRNNPNGNRRSPYSIRPGVYPNTYGDLASSSECHDAGEIWANAMWIARALLVARYGFVNGSKVAMQLSLDGYKLSPSTPDFLDVRDAVLAADTASYGGANQCLLWSAFARMGIGASASSTGADDTAPVEAFDTPLACTPQISVTPTVVNFGHVPVEPVGTENGIVSTSFNVCNVGNSDLYLTNVVLQAPNEAFSIIAPSPKGFPLPISHDFCHAIEVRCNPTSAGTTTAVLQIESSDPDDALIAPTTLQCTGATPAQQVSPNPLSFGNVPIDAAGGQEDFKDLPMKVRNTGTSNLRVTGIASSGGNAADFTLLPPVTGLPTIIAPGSEYDFRIRFNPSATGPRATTIATSGNAGTSNITANGAGVVPSIRVTGSGDVGEVCADEVEERTISVCNTGDSHLVVESASIDCPDFTIVNNPFPATVSHDFCAPLTVRFTPTTAGPKSCTLTIQSNDPTTPTVSFPLAGDTPLTTLDVAPSQGFLPEVTQAAGSCQTKKPFPVSNPGQCKARVTAVAVGGPDGGDFGVSGLPVTPTVLEPGHQLGQGDLNTFFAPTALDRDRQGTVAVTYVSEPITGDTTTVTRELCGEGANTGARVLVTQGGVPLAKVERIQIQRINANRNRTQVDTVDTATNVALQAVTPAAPCPAFQYHREFGTVANPVQLAPGAYQVTTSAIIGGKRQNKTVAFDVGTCDFNPTVTVNY